MRLLTLLVDGKLLRARNNVSNLSAEGNEVCRRLTPLVVVVVLPLVLLAVALVLVLVLLPQLRSFKMILLSLRMVLLR